MAEAGSAIAPRLITRDEATALCGGVRPEKLGVAAIRAGRAVRYDRKAIDSALDRLSGLVRVETANDAGAEEKLKIWRQQRGV